MRGLLLWGPPGRGPGGRRGWSVHFAALAGVGAGPVVFECGPVALRELAVPGLDTLAHLVGVAVGGLHDRLIEPVCRGAVRPIDAAGDLHVVLRRLAAEHAVDDGAGFGACDPVFRFDTKV